ncbi:hypothetical protein [Deinococcus sp. QL22]|uniref:hypothetical protein n=1 Tax=Deinococcus sp. QL22 TaxID=2939437 RepID=UPI0020170088|nr:hypothetical protein [Deinococcus sp. QL22]UQN09586.1 hypothetical protein M1R55_25915 [Deinococcus sp. QL22]
MMPFFQLFRFLNRGLWVLLVLGVVLGGGWIVLIWKPAQAAALIQQHSVHQREGAAIAQACLHDLRQRFGNTPMLSHSEAQSWTWTGPLEDEARGWTMDGTLHFGEQLAAFECDGVQSSDGVVEVRYAYGTPWWTPPPTWAY